MGPQNQRPRGMATLADIQMLAENIGQVEANLMPMAQAINNNINKVDAVDRALFVTVHFLVNDTMDFTDETVAKTKEFLESGVKSLMDYNDDYSKRMVAEAHEALGDTFTIMDQEYTKTVKHVEAQAAKPKTEMFPGADAVEAHDEDEYKRGDEVIDENTYNGALLAAHQELKDAEANKAEDKDITTGADAATDDTPEEDKALAKEQAEKEAAQAPAEPSEPTESADDTPETEAPAEAETPTEEPKDEQSNS